MTTQTDPAQSGFGNRILVPLDGSALSAQAVSLARALAAPDAEITLLHVVDSGKQTEQALIDLERVVHVFREVLAPEQRLETLVLTGDPEDIVLQEAARRNVDLIALASRGRGALGRLRFGSVADHISHNSPCHVAVIHPEHMDGDAEMAELPVAVTPVQRLLLPVDGTDRSAQATPIVAALAQTHSLPVVVLTAVDFVPTSTPMFGQDIGMSIGVAGVLDELEDAAQSWLAETSQALTHAGVVDVEQRRLNGSPGNAIVQQVKPGDLIVMASHDREGIDRLLSGSVSEHIVRSGAAPVLLVR